MKCRILILAAVLINTIPRLFDITGLKVIRGEFTDIQAEIFMKSQQLSFLVFIMGFILKDASKQTAVWIWWAFFLCLSNTLDELIFDPYILQRGELFVVSEATLVSIYLHSLYSGYGWAKFIHEMVLYESNRLKSLFTDFTNSYTNE